jgi:hypothetical protein
MSCSIVVIVASRARHINAAKEVDREFEIAFQLHARCNNHNNWCDCASRARAMQQLQQLSSACAFAPALRVRCKHRSLAVPAPCARRCARPCTVRNPHPTDTHVLQSASERGMCSVQRELKRRGGYSVLSLDLAETPAFLIQRFFCPL